jgi:hypothetical protein
MIRTEIREIMPNRVAYKRPKNRTQLSPTEKRNLVTAYLAHYKKLVRSDPKALNQKLPRKALANLLDSVGAILLAEAEKLHRTPGPVKSFLRKNPLPPLVASSLPPDFRAFCLTLNALKQWIAAEQAATDKYLLGGRARKLCREGTTHCPLCSEKLASDLTLHHPVRDGRPPVPLCKACHEKIEGQSKSK